MNDRAMLIRGIQIMQQQAHANAVEHGFYDAVNETTAFLREHKAEHLAAVVRRDFTLAQLAKIDSEAGEAVHVIQHDGAREELAEELADIMIRVADLADYLRIDLGRAVSDKMAKNASRPRLHDKTC